MSSEFALKAMPRMPTVMAGQIVLGLELLHHVQRQALVDEHRRMAEEVVVVVERGELHRVLEQARSRGETRARQVCRTGVAVGQGIPDALEIQAVAVRDHVELVRRRELQVAPVVREQLRELGLLRVEVDELVGQQAEQRGRPIADSLVARPDTAAAARTTRSLRFPRRSAPGRKPRRRRGPARAGCARPTA